MTQIDPARLARVLNSLIKPKESSGSARTGNVSNTSTPATRGSARDPAVLKARLRTRLQALRDNDADFASAAPQVAVQEILRWEFGEEVLEHGEFERVATQVAESLLAHDSLGPAMQRMIERLIVKA